MKIEHKNSGEIFDEFPVYGKHNHTAHYGYLVVTDDLEVLFFYICDEMVAYQNVTEYYNIHP